MYVKVQRVQCIILSLICSSYETKYVCIYVLLWYCEVHVASSNIMIWPQLTTIKIDDGLYLCSTKQCSCGQSKQNRREGKIIKYIPSLKEVYYIPSLKDLYLYVSQVSRAKISDEYIANTDYNVLYQMHQNTYLNFVQYICTFLNSHILLF